MEETLQLNTEPLQKSVKVKQNIAAWLLVLTNVYWIFSNATGVALLEGILQPIIIGLTCIIAWGFLYSIASNKATRIVTIIGIVHLFINGISNIIPFICDYDYSNIPVVWFMLINILLYLLSIYTYSTLLKANTNISNNDKTWIGIILIHFTFRLSYFIFYCIYNINPTYITEYNWLWLIIIFNIFTLIAEFRFAKCAAFSGNYNPEPAAKGTFSPLNKYFVATLVAVAFILGLLYLLYSNVEIIENIL